MLCRWCSEPAEQTDTCIKCQSVIDFLDSPEGQAAMETFTDEDWWLDR